ncbi:MAG: hypothetical protein QM691_15250 [Opitutaceae bacterium]
MNSSDRSLPPVPATMEQVVDELLESIRGRFYTATDPLERGARRRFHRDRRMLLYALTWPATWLERRGLTCPPGRYRRLIDERLAAIAAHGDPACYGAFFPRYLLKCLQDFFARHGDDLYGDLKHIRNALDQVLASARFAQRVRDDARQLDVLVATHRLLHARHAARVAPRDPSQMKLF